MCRALIWLVAELRFDWVRFGPFWVRFGCIRGRNGSVLGSDFRADDLFSITYWVRLLFFIFLSGSRFLSVPCPRVAGAI